VCSLITAWWDWTNGGTAVRKRQTWRKRRFHRALALGTGAGHIGSANRTHRKLLTARDKEVRCFTLARILDQILQAPLQERYYGFPNHATRRIQRVCSLDKATKAASGSSEPSGSSFWTPPENSHFSYNKNQGGDSRPRNSRSGANPLHPWSKFFPRSVRLTEGARESRRLHPTWSTFRCQHNAKVFLLLRKTSRLRQGRLPTSLAHLDHKFRNVAKKMVSAVGIEPTTYC